MATARGDKPLLTFGSGVWSPEHGARVDLAKAQGALKQSENFIVEPYGSLRRRPGLRFVGVVAGSEGGGGMANQFVQVPAVTSYLRAISVDGAFSQVQFLGTIRCFGDGRMRFVGTIERIPVNGDAATNVDYEVWVGASSSVGAFVTLGSAAIFPGTDIDVTVDPGVGESVFLLLGNRLSSPQTIKVRAVAFPDGWQLPLTLRVDDNGFAAHHEITISKSGNDVVMAGDYVTDNTIGQLFSSERDSGFVEANFTVHFNQVASNVGYSYARTIPATAGTGVTVFAGIGRSVVNRLFGIGQIGPIMREAPVIEGP